MKNLPPIFQQYNATMKIAPGTSNVHHVLGVMLFRSKIQVVKTSDQDQNRRIHGPKGEAYRRNIIQRLHPTYQNHATVLLIEFHKKKKISLSAVPPTAHMRKAAKNSITMKIKIQVMLKTAIIRTYNT